MTDPKPIFDAVRQIKGSGLTQSDVDLLNRALMGEVATAANGFKVSQRGLDLIHSFESLAKVRPDGMVEAYPDPGPTGLPWTIGWGSTGPDIGRGTVWTKAQCNERFAKDIAKFEIGVNMLIGNAPTTQNQFDALVSFAYNVGLDIDDDTQAEGLGDSTLLKKHLARDYVGAAGQFAAWNKAKGKVLSGLTRRRAAEAALYGIA